MLVRKICPYCRKKPVAVNYHKNGIVHYRNKCAQCYRHKRKPLPLGWIRAGYKKKEKCEQCGFRFKYTEQSQVIYIDGDTNNNDWVNLRTICLNCQEAIKHSNLPWRHSKLDPD